MLTYLLVWAVIYMRLTEFLPDQQEFRQKLQALAFGLILEALSAEWRLPSFESDPRQGGSDTLAC
jgi:hypothetical protein